MDGNIVAQLFPGIASLMVQDTTIAIARIALIAFGFILAYLGFKRILEPLIMVPMGIGMICINCGVLFLDGGKLVPCSWIRWFPILHNWLISCRLTSCNRFTT